MTPSIGTGAPLDVDRLIESRLLVQANSGAGKSWALRRLLEQSYARVPQIVIDVEGEFHTLREKYDYVLAGQKGGDCPADVKSATLLARRLLELNVSAIVDIYELGVQRTRFVRLFLEALVNAPRELWHPTLVVIDEAHMFAPEAGQAESADAVKDLMTRGRKRGFCGVLATQRISKLHKDAAAECNNKLVGRSSLDIDMKRAAAELGFTTREDMQRLRTLAPGTFYAFGPALSDEVRLISIGPVATTHPKAGERAAAPTPPRDKVKKILAQLADLPHEAEEEARTIAEWRTKAKQLEAELRKATAAQPAAKVETKIVEVPVLDKETLASLMKAIAELDMRTADLAGAVVNLDRQRDRLAQSQQAVVSEADNLRRFTERLASPKPAPRPITNGHTRAVYPSKHADRVRVDGARPSSTGLPEGEAKILRALIQYPNGLERAQLGVLTTYKRSTRDSYIQRLRERGYVDVQGDRVVATSNGIAAMPGAEPLPTGEALQAYWLDRLPEGERAILRVLIQHSAYGVDRDTLSEATGYKRSTRDSYLQRLAAKELVVALASGRVRASETLFEVT